MLCSLQILFLRNVQNLLVRLVKVNIISHNFASLDLLRLVLPSVTLLNECVRQTKFSNQLPPVATASLFLELESNKMEDLRDCQKYSVYTISSLEGPFWDIQTL